MTEAILRAEGRTAPPDWALRQRHLFDLMDRGRTASPRTRHVRTAP